MLRRTFYAIHGEFEATIEIASGEVNGSLPQRALAHVQEGRMLHRQELTDVWNLARASKPLPRIAPSEWHYASSLVHAEYVQDYILRLRFADGAESEIDLAVELHGEVFEPLREKAYFAQVTLHPELRTVVWPNGTDFAPEFLRSALQIAA